jgi:hypothetical protein
MRSRLKFRRRELLIKGALVLMAKIIEIIKIIKLIISGQLSKLSKEVKPAKVAKAAATVDRINLFNAECLDAGIRLGITGLTVWFFAP